MAFGCRTIIDDEGSFSNYGTVSRFLRPRDSHALNLRFKHLTHME